MIVPAVPNRPRNPELPLTEQAKGMPRREIMKRIAGPAIDRLVRPVFNPVFSRDEESLIVEVSEFAPLGNLVELNLVSSIARVRLERECETQADLHSQLERLAAEHAYLFYHSTLWETLNEGVTSGVVVPFKTAEHVYFAENPRSKIRGLSNDLSNSEFPKDEPFDPAAIIDIMDRPVFAEILHVLTKGPNGFLGMNSNIYGSSINFFDFRGGKNKPLKSTRAFKLDGEGRVCGLSDAYHLAAERKRKQQKAGSPDKHGTDSSGCPVRHRFEDATGILQPSLVASTIDFAIAALRVSAGKTAGKL